MGSTHIGIQGQSFINLPVEKLYVDERKNLSNELTDEKGGNLNAQFQ